MKYLYVAVCAALTLSLAACGGPEKPFPKVMPTAAAMTGGAPADSWERLAELPTPLAARRSDGL
jgi:hypothetical protein